MRVGVHSRFVPEVTKKEYIQKMETGEIDVMVGTHGLLTLGEKVRAGKKKRTRLKYWPHLYALWFFFSGGRRQRGWDLNACEEAVLLASF